MFTCFAPPLGVVILVQHFDPDKAFDELRDPKHIHLACYFSNLVNKEQDKIKHVLANS